MVNINVNIIGITGQSPYDVYVCQSSINDCVYINTISGTTYSFDIPKPLDNSLQYIIKIIDSNNIILTKVVSVSNEPSVTATTAINQTVRFV
jgi:hypothetical protein